ncbi:MAG: branched-chain amino acid ABC transporter permease, partial [Firmicutes bacterium]|nr:branched-chain amino acid ABC transporter permease [Candidatus Scybalomonas excrementavium]
MKKLLSKQNIFRIIAIIGIFLVLYLAVENGILTRQYSYLLVPVGINVILAVSLNLTTGYLGELTLGHAGFMSVGAYAGGLFSIYANLPYFPGFILALLVGGIVAAFFGLLIGIPVLRLRGDYLAIVTLAFGEIIRSVITNLPVTGGASGLNNIPMYTTYISVYVVVIFTILIVMNLVNSRHGRAICSIREDYIASESVGISLTKYKILAFV